MATNYLLVNFTKREQIVFAHIAAGTARELAGNEASSAVTTWYLLTNLGDQISFVSDTGADWPFPGGGVGDLAAYTEVTDRVVAELIQAGILRDLGRRHEDPDEPDAIYVRHLKNVWDSDG